MTGDVWIAPGFGLNIQRALDELPPGGTVHLEPGEYQLTEPLLMPSKTTLQGSRSQSSRLVLTSGPSCHMVTNVPTGAEDIVLRNLEFLGNSALQRNLADGPERAQICGIYFYRSRRITVENVVLKDIRQTGVHFTNCQNLSLSGMTGSGFGWSGIGATGCDQLAMEGSVFDTGLETRHSAVHIDGGENVSFRGEVSRSAGNGVMLDSGFRPLNNVTVSAAVEQCFRGVGVIGGRNDNPLTNVRVTGSFRSNEAAGILVSNTDHVLIEDALIEDNDGPGIAFGGKSGGSHCTVQRCRFDNNHPDLKEIKPSHDNRFLENTFA